MGNEKFISFDDVLRLLAAQYNRYFDRGMSKEAWAIANMQHLFKEIKESDIDIDQLIKDNNESWYGR